jgi:hypothetical protein
MRFLQRWADAQLRAELADSATDVDRLKRQLAVMEAERDTLAEVVERNRRRVKAETALATRTQSEHERHGRTDQGSG